MTADPFRFVRRFALITAIVVILVGIVVILRRSPLAGGLYVTAGALLLLAGAQSTAASGDWPERRWHRSALVRGLLVAAFAAFLGGTLLVPRQAAPGDPRGVADSPVANQAASQQGDEPVDDDAPPPPTIPTTTPAVVVTPATVQTARPVSVTTSAPVGSTATTVAVPPVAASPTLTRAEYLARIDGAWAASDWPAVDAAAREALVRYPGDAELEDKLVAARINRGDDLAARGQPADAARAYASAREVRPDPAIDARLAALSPTPVVPPPTGTPAPSPTVSFAGACQPTGIFVTEWFVAQVGVLNTGSSTLNGVRVRAAGPWEYFTLSRLDPPDITSLQGTAGTPELVTNAPIPPGQAFYFQLVAYANQIGVFQFGFQPARLDGEWLVDQGGSIPVVACAVAVGEP